MVTDTSDDLVESAKRYLDAVFGSDTDTSLLTTLPASSLVTSIDAVDREFITSNTSPKASTKTSETDSTVPTTDEKRTSTDSALSIQTNETVDSSTDSNDIDVTDDTLQVNAPTRTQVMGVLETTLKQKSMIGTDNDEESNPGDVADVTDELHIENSSHLFWVPAHLHPEIAPNEFRKWLQTHAHAAESGVGTIKRRKTKLSKQYIPSETEEEEEEGEEGDESEEKLPEKKTPAFDWEAFGAAEDALSPNIESTKLTILRRSLSLDLPPFMASTIDHSKFDRNSSPDDDSPVLVPRVAPALKRTARTKLRRNSIAGDQPCRHAPPHRRTQSTQGTVDNESNIAGTSPTIVVISDDVESSADATATEDATATDTGIVRITLSDNPVPIIITLADDPVVETEDRPKRSSSLSQDAKLAEKLETVQESSPEVKPQSNRTSVPAASSANTVTKKSSWYPFSKSTSKSDKESKADKDVTTDKENNIDKPPESTSGALVVKEKSKISTISTLFTLFSWSLQSKSKTSSEVNNTTAASPTTELPSPTTPKKTKYSNYSRFPLHVERAIYRLSHIKLANPRRPLHEQVLISNMMFWYLSLINKQQTEYGGEGNPKARKEAMKVKSKVGKSNGSRKRKKGSKKKGASGNRRKRNSGTEIAYKAPQYDVQQVQIAQQYLTPPASPAHSTSPYSFDDSDSESDCSTNSEEFESYGYHHYADEYISDGTDGGHLDDGGHKDQNGLYAATNGHGSSLNLAPPKKRAPSPHPEGRSHGGLVNGSPIKTSDDEDDDVPLGLYKVTQVSEK